MGYEIKFLFHARKEEGGYNTENQEEKLVKIGKPFDETPLEKVAASIMGQLARRDIWVVGVEVSELVKKEINFKECKDGRGIVLKNKRFSFNEATQMVAEDVVEECVSPVQPEVDNLYSNPNRPAPVVKTSVPAVNQKKVLYKVYFDPNYQDLNRSRHLKLTKDKEYAVHQVIPSPTGNLMEQKLAVTDDVGRVVIVEERFFTAIGAGLFADNQLDFSGVREGPAKKPKLAFENDMSMPMDNGMIPEHLMTVPDIRRK